MLVLLGLARDKPPLPDFSVSCGSRKYKLTMCTIDRRDEREVMNSRRNEKGGAGQESGTESNEVEGGGVVVRELPQRGG